MAAGDDDGAAGHVDGNVDARGDAGVEVVVGDGDAEEPDRRLVPAVDEGERARDDAFDAQACGGPPRSMWSAWTGKAAWVGTCVRVPPSIGRGRDARLAFECPGSFLARRSASERLAGHDNVMTGTDLFAEIGVRVLETMAPELFVRGAGQNERGGDDLRNVRLNHDAHGRVQSA